MVREKATGNNDLRLGHGWLDGGACLVMPLSFESQLPMEQSVWIVGNSEREQRGQAWAVGASFRARHDGSSIVRGVNGLGVSLQAPPVVRFCVNWGDSHNGIHLILNDVDLADVRYLSGFESLLPVAHRVRTEVLHSRRMDSLTMC